MSMTGRRLAGVRYDTSQNGTGRGATYKRRRQIGRVLSRISGRSVLLSEHVIPRPIVTHHEPLDSTELKVARHRPRSRLMSTGSGHAWARERAPREHTYPGLSHPGSPIISRGRLTHISPQSPIRVGRNEQQ